jgi:hypothetical protein
VAHPLCNTFVTAADVTKITGYKSVPDVNSPQTGLGGQWLDWRSPNGTFHILPGSLCQYLTTNAPWAGDYDNDGFVSVVWGASAAYWNGLNAYQRSSNPNAVHDFRAPYTKLGPDEYVNAANLPANGYGPYPGIRQFPTILYAVARWTPHHNIILVAFLPATLAATEAELQSVLLSHPGF